MLPFIEIRLLRRHWQVISGSCLKVIAMIAMVVDHSAFLVLRHDATLSMTICSFGNHHISLYYLMRCIGRLAFPIFAFLLVEGFLHTHNRKKYGCNLLTFALISEIPFDLVRRNTFFVSGLNVFFTLFLGFLALYAVSKWEEGQLRKSHLTAYLFILIGIGILSHCDYGTSGVSFVLLLYVLRRNHILRAAIGCCFLGSRWIAGLAFIPISMYNGQRGFIHGAIAKYIFYIFYPAHLLVLYFIRLWSGG